MPSLPYSLSCTLSYPSFGRFFFLVLIIPTLFFAALHGPHLYIFTRASSELFALAFAEELKFAVEPCTTDLPYFLV